MSTVAEFIELRKNIETLTTQITLSAEHNAVKDSKQHLDEANNKLELLKAMISNDVQIVATDRLSRQLASLGVKVEKMVAKTPVKKAVTRKKQQSEA